MASQTEDKSSTSQDTFQDAQPERKSLHSQESSSSSNDSEAVQDTRGTLKIPEEPQGVALSPIASHVSGADLGRKATGRSIATLDPGFEVDFDDDENPRSWSMAYKCLIIFLMSISCTCIVLYSTSYTSGIPGIMEDFGIASETVAVLGLSIYLIGLAVGSIIVAPLSEMYGRRLIYIVTQILFIIFIIPCGLAQNLQTIIVCRFFGALAGSALISNSPGTIADIVDEKYRALAFSVWSMGPMQGPVIGPIIGGFVYEYLGWRWTNWVVMIWAGVSFCALLLIKETYAPKLLREKAQKLRQETDDKRYWSRYDERKTVMEVLNLNLSRPFIMMATEPICIFWNVFIGLVYAVLYLCFVAYPIVFSQQRHWSAGLTGLGYLGIGVGGTIVIVSEPLIRRVIDAHKPDPATGKPPPEAMVSIVVVGSLLVPTGELIFAWTCTPNVHWIAPILAGIPFGAGNCCVFIYASNYLVHSYGVFAASALAGNTVFRSILGATLPLAGPKLYESLGSNWAGTLLGLLEVGLVPIPLVFYRYGHKIRERSTWIRKLRADQERLESKRRSAQLGPANGVVEPEKGEDVVAEKTIVEEDKEKV